jgi:cytochrome b
MPATTENTRVKVWDTAVRVFHWSLVVFFVVAYISGEIESELLHAYAGYAVLALVAFRMVWGLVGTKHARFPDFIFGSAATLRYAKSLLSSKPLRYLGHNPLGGWMVVALLACLFGACWSGLEAYGAQGHGPLASSGTAVISQAAANGDRDRRGEHERKRGKTGAEEFWEEIHEALSHLTLLLVLLHVIGVLIASALHRENLIKAMITGYKTRRAP